VKRQRPPVRGKLDGLCDYATRTIYVNPAAADQRSTLLHEVLHAALPDLTESAVEQTEEALEMALRKCQEPSNESQGRQSGPARFRYSAVPRVRVRAGQAVV